MWLRCSRLVLSTLPVQFKLFLTSAYVAESELQSILIPSWKVLVVCVRYYDASLFGCMTHDFNDYNNHILKFQS